MGIAYHGNYFTWLEVARIHLLDSIGCPYKELEENGYLLPVIRCECEFKSPARFDDIIDIEVHLPKLNQVRLNLEYSIRKGENLLAKAKTSHAFVDFSGRVVKTTRSICPKSKKSNLIRNLISQLYFTWMRFRLFGRLLHST